jgi:hypothetical protein
MVSSRSCNSSSVLALIYGLVKGWRLAENSDGRSAAIKP